MKKNILLFLLFTLLWGCNDKPGIPTEPDKKLRVFPNLVQDEVFINVSNQDGEELTLHVFDTFGKTLFESTISSSQAFAGFRLSLGDKPKGQYQTILRSTKTSINQNFIKI
ncbi:hypothetical protein [Telluribacter sp.]|jgi:hypothetical protein|uniref:hypothetical protein n=1 Tax=Telluribacter sp. TaxID=1978767 RepID=UPI002E125BD2|nr:hypothetical protein [Telluribacter sp.]